MAEWRHRPAFDQVHISAPFGPARESLPRKLGPPSEPTHDRLQHRFDQVPQPRIRTDTAEEDHLAARSEHTGALVECRFRVWHSRNHMICYNHIE